MELKGTGWEAEKLRSVPALLQHISFNSSGLEFSHLYNEGIGL